jgi:hypothetical protein
MPFPEDLSVFFSTAMFASSGSLVVGTSTTSVAGIVDNEYADPFGNIVQGSSPRFTCSAATVPGVKHGDTLIVNALTYKVRGVEPDGTGLVVLRLEQQ